MTYTSGCTGLIPPGHTGPSLWAARYLYSGGTYTVIVTLSISILNITFWNNSHLFTFLSPNGLIIYLVYLVGQPYCLPSYYQTDLSYIRCTLLVDRIVHLFVTKRTSHLSGISCWSIFLSYCWASSTWLRVTETLIISFQLRLQ